MKFLFLLLTITIFISCSDEKNSSKEAKDKSYWSSQTDSIMHVIDNETAYFYASNYEGWKNCWLHDTISSQTWNNDDGSFSSAQGWNAIDRQGKSWIEKYYKSGETVIHPSFFRKEIHTRFLSDTAAYLTWVQYNEYSDKPVYGVSRESRLMIYHDSSWKITNVSAFWDSKNRIPKDSALIIKARI